jgi:starch-binding outer membrane protein SusE/F
MRSIFNLILLITGTGMLLTACNKVGDLPYYGNGTAPTLSASVTTVAPAPTDSLKQVLTLSWTSPKYATSGKNMKYTIEIDSTGKNFSNPGVIVVDSSLSRAILAKELNDILLAKGYAFNAPVDMDVRVISSYANNNERLTSNTVKIKMTPYKVPPKVAPPTTNTLFIVGDATAGGWGNPVPLPAQQFTKIDETTYEGTFYLNGGKQYLVVIKNGEWDKYSVANNSLPGLSLGGTFGAGLSDNFPGPAATGMYKIRLDFQSGLFTVTPAGPYALMYVPGDYQGWTPATASQLGSPGADGKYEGYVYFPAGGSFEFKLTTTPDWNNALGDAGSGTLSPGGGNLKVPSEGYYRILANTNDNTWSATKTSWSMIGDFNGWGSDADMTYDTGSKTWSGTINVASDGFFKFRANHDWGLNLGDKNADGSLEKDGDNIAIKAGAHTVTLYLNNAGYFTYKIQ